MIHLIRLDLSVCLFVCLSVCMSICLSVCLAVYLSVCLPVYHSVDGVEATATMWFITNTIECESKKEKKKIVKVCEHALIDDFRVFEIGENCQSCRDSGFC